MKFEDIIKRKEKRLKRQKNAVPKFNLWTGREGMAKIIKHQNKLIIETIGEYKGLLEYQIENMIAEFVIPRNYVPEVYREKRIGNEKFEKKIKNFEKK